jgi:hypothetical protein
MAAGDILMPTNPVYCKGGAALKAHLVTLNVISGGSVVNVIPVSGRDDTYLVYQYTVEEYG